MYTQIKYVILFNDIYLLQVERNVLDVSYHVSQYRTIISELRDEITRLKSKMNEDRPRSGSTTNDKGERLKLLRDQIVSTFREQMKLRYDFTIINITCMKPQL